jgi:succinate dehydrogenase (ubiquinone) cytochrome b560 subunit
VHRITGVALAGGLYAFLIGYVAGPLVGISFDSASLVGFFGALPLVGKLALKFIYSIPFTFHVANGFRHLIWDTGSQLTLKGVYRTGYAVIGLTAIGSLVLTFL